MINLTINKMPVSVEEGTTILEAARQIGIQVPSLCYLKDVHQFGSCRLCVVEVEGAKNLQASCIVPVKEGMVVRTNTKRVTEARKVLFELLISDHPKDCLSCSRNLNCELQAMGELLGVTESRYDGAMSSDVIDVSPSIIRDNSKCILCRRCISVCNKIQHVGVINAQNRGFDTVVSPAMELPLSEVDCSYCGQCVAVCPVGALSENSAIESVQEALDNPQKRVVVQTAPAVRVALGEEFKMEPGTIVTGKMSAALHRIGFDDVFDTNFAADLTILEEGTEFLSRVKAALTGKKTVLPMITSCSPGWIKYVEHTFPEQLDHLSTCKSPHAMFGAVVKSYYAEKLDIKPEDMFVVSVMPCTAKKFEIVRPEMQNDGNKNVDAVLTTRELAKLIKQNGIDFVNLKDEPFDNPLGLSSGAADIFGVTGGVMEAALRTVYEIVTGRELPFPKLHVSPIVGLKQVKEASFVIDNPKPEYSFLDGVEVKVAVTSGLEGAKILMEQIEKGISPYHFIEVMGCPSGCINGGGQPRMSTPEIRNKRMEAIYREDEGKQVRKSHENEDLLKLYEVFLGEPNGHISHELLHTTYTRRGLYNQLVDKE